MGNAEMTPAPEPSDLAGRLREMADKIEGRRTTFEIESVVSGYLREAAARIEALEKALEPFAKLAIEFVYVALDSDTLTASDETGATTEQGVTVGDFRAASALLERMKGEGK